MKAAQVFPAVVRAGAEDAEKPREAAAEPRQMEFF